MTQRYRIHELDLQEKPKWNLLVVYQLIYQSWAHSAHKPANKVQLKWKPDVQYLWGGTYFTAFFLPSHVVWIAWISLIQYQKKMYMHCISFAILIANPDIVVHFSEFILDFLGEQFHCFFYYEKKYGKEWARGVSCQKSVWRIQEYKKWNMFYSLFN